MNFTSHNTKTPSDKISLILPGGIFTNHDLGVKIPKFHITWIVTCFVSDHTNPPLLTALHNRSGGLFQSYLHCMLIY